MALLSVTIPTKELVVDFSAAQVVNAIKNLPKVLKCTLFKSDDVLKQYDLNFTSFASMGNVLTLNIQELEANKTKITINITRAVGTFNQAHEVQSAEIHYKQFSKGLSMLLSTPDMTDEQMAAHKKAESGSLFGTLVKIVLYATAAIIILGIIAS
jgi:hypothetical protein